MKGRFCLRRDEIEKGVPDESEGVLIGDVLDVCERLLWSRVEVLERCRAAGVV